MKTQLPNTSKNLKGFTLIELMVAITIVAILAVIALVIFSGIQKSGRDTRRKEEIASIATALESRKTVTNGTYRFQTADLQREFPSTTNAYAGNDPSGNPYCVYTWTSTGSVTARMTFPTTGVSDCVTAQPALNATINGTAVAGTAEAFPASINNGALSVANSVTIWVLCANLETSTVPYCKLSTTGS